MTKKTAKKKTATKKTATKKTAAKKAKAKKAAAAPKLTDRQLDTLKRVEAAPATPAYAFDRRTLNSLAAKNLVSGTKTISITKAGAAFLGA